MKKLALVAFYLVSLLLTARLASHASVEYQLAAHGQQLERMQGELALRHLQRYQALQHDLEKGCRDVVLEKLKISVATESVLVASILKSQRSNEFSQYLAQHAPGLEQTLTGYVSPYGNAWKDPACN